MRLTSPVIFLSVYFLVLGTLQTSQATECKPWEAHSAQQTSLKIGKITVETLDVFDLDNTKESTLLHRASNKLHNRTHSSVIRKQLLFKTGDEFQLRELLETERKLRENRFLKDASVTPAEVCGKQVNINVTTRDNWTLTPGASFGRSGGSNASGIELQEHNLFGLGKSLSISYKNDKDRNSTLLSYDDPLFLDSRHHLYASIQDNSDGKGHALELGRPFFELDSKRAWKISTSSLNQQTSLYDKGDVTAKIGQQLDSHQLAYSWSKGLVNDHVKRFNVGWQYDKTSYFKTDTFSGKSPGIVESYPWLEYQDIQEKYLTKTNFKTMGKVEDIFLGRSISAGIGLLGKTFGSDDNYLKLSSSFSQGFELGNNQLGFIDLKGISYLGNGPLNGETVSIAGQWYSFKNSGNDLYASALLKSSSNLKLGEDFLLGGDTGLRGYPAGYQSGDKLAVLTVEKRFHYDWYPLHIAKFGAVAFADIGTAWGTSEDSKILADIGIGIRVVPTRTSSAKTLHIDLAFPLTDRNEADSFQILLRTSNSF